MERKPKSPAEVVVLRLIDAFCREDKEGMLACLAPDFVRYGEETSWKPMSKQGYREFVDNFKLAFTNWNWEILDMVSEGDTVAVDLMESATLSHPWPLRGQIIQPNHETYHTRTFIFSRLMTRD